MVRLIPVTRNGKTVWVEDAPSACPAGHEQLVPTWGPCPVCADPVRLWKCAVDGCDNLLFDDEHVHDARKFGRSGRP
jgi:hypothetical protein